MPRRQKVAWRDVEGWARLRDGTACPICKGGKPKDVVAELPASWVTAPRKAPLPGYVCVVSKTHAVEPFELPSKVRARFWQDVLVVGKSVAARFKPVKMNYEIHGNSIPHLHVHIYPRFVGDPFEGKPIDWRRPRFVRHARDIALIRGSLAAALNSRGRRLRGGRADPLPSNNGHLSKKV